MDEPEENGLPDQTEVKFLLKFYSPSLPCIFFKVALKPCPSDWYLNPCARTQTQPKPTVFQLRSHTWFQDLMKLRFLMSHCRKNSVRDKVIGKKWIYLERNTLHRKSVGHLRSESGPRVWGSQFYRGG